MDALIIVNLILNIFIFLALGFAIYLLNKKMAEDAQRAKTFSDGLARLDKHFKIGEQLLAKKLKENEDKMKSDGDKTRNELSNELQDVKKQIEGVFSEVKDLSSYEELK